MTIGLSRRNLLISGSASAGALALATPFGARAADSSGIPLTAGTRTLEVNGRPAVVFGLTGPAGRPGLVLAPGDNFHVRLENSTSVPTIIHWHGQLPPWKQDGTPWPQTPPIPAGGAHGYNFTPISGTFWMHSHLGLQEQALMAAPLIVRDAADMRAEDQEVVVMLHDFSFDRPEALLARLMRENARSSRSSPMMGMGGMPQDLNDIRYDAFLANDRTLDDPEVVRVGSQIRVRLRIINGATASQFWIDLGSLTGTLTAVDGRPVHPIQAAHFPLAIAQRLDILLTIPGQGVFPVLARLEGSRRRTGIILATAGSHVPKIPTLANRTVTAVSAQLESRLRALHPLPPRAVDIVHRVTLAGSMSPYRWSMNGEYWPNITPLMVRQGQRVVIDMLNHSNMAHPMHLHGHSFQVIAINDRPIQGAMRDTVLVPPMMGRVRIAFDADNPGRWAFHCHNLYHMATGMATEVRYLRIVPPNSPEMAS